MARETVDGTKFLHDYLQHLAQGDRRQYRRILRDMVVKLSIWFPASMYEQLPILFPHVVRERVPKPQYASPNNKGYLRDDNTLIKDVVRSLEIHSSSFVPYMGRRRGNGFWAAHIWDKTSDGRFTTKIACTNSFIPNLVWLPESIAKLTDVEGSDARQLVQAISRTLYQNITVHDDLSPFTEEAWQLLPTEAVGPVRVPNPRELNYFCITPEFIQNRLIRINAAHDLLKWVQDGRISARPDIAKRVLARRYIGGLESKASLNVTDLCTYLGDYREAAQSVKARVESRVSFSQGLPASKVRCRWWWRRSPP